MGQHEAKPPKLPEKVRTRTHQWIVFCKHMIVETMAGFTAIIIFEAYRADWLNMLGHDEIHAIGYITFLM